MSNPSVWSHYCAANNTVYYAWLECCPSCGKCRPEIPKTLSDTIAVPRKTLIELRDKIDQLLATGTPT